MKKKLDQVEENKIRRFYKTKKVRKKKHQNQRFNTHRLLTN